MANEFEIISRQFRRVRHAKGAPQASGIFLNWKTSDVKAFVTFSLRKKDVCEQCQGHCPDNGLICRRMVVLVLSTDCESGNKTAFEIIKSKIVKGETDPWLWLISILSDYPNVGKSHKASFSNWWLKCGDERSNLSQLRNLRNRSNDTTKEKFRKLVPKDDHMKTKDRQDSLPFLNWASKTWLTNWVELGKSVISELDKFTQQNRTRMIPSPISIAVANYVWILFQAFDAKSNTSKLSKARLHSPVDKLSSL